MSGFWDTLFPGGIGELADNFLSTVTPDYGYILSEDTWEGTEGDDVYYFIYRRSLFLEYYNPYYSSILLYGGNDAIEFGGACSNVLVDLGEGDQNVFKANSQVRYSTLLGRGGSDLFLFAQGGHERGSLYMSSIDSGGGNDLIIIEKDEGVSIEEANIVGSIINTGDGDDVVAIQGFGETSAPGDLGYSIVELGDGNDTFTLVQSERNTTKITATEFYLDAGTGDDIVDLSNTSAELLHKFSFQGNHGYDILILPEGSDSSNYLDFGFETIISGDDIVSLNQAPKDIILSNEDFFENIDVGSVVATLSTTDSDADDTHTYSLVSGDGDIDNSAFTIDGDQLKIFDSPDFEAKSSYSVRLQTKDSGGLTFEKTFTLTVNDLEEGPVDADGDGFVDEVTYYQIWTASGGVDLTNRRGRTYSDDTSRKWDAIKAVESDTGFSVLVEGHLSKEGKYKVVAADDEGVIGRATRWLNGNQMLDNGYEEVFSIDFNGNGVVDLI